jgi:hypothetical protein
MRIPFSRLILFGSAFAVATASPGTNSRSGPVAAAYPKPLPEHRHDGH